MRFCHNSRVPTRGHVRVSSSDQAQTFERSIEKQKKLELRNEPFPLF